MVDIHRIHCFGPLKCSTILSGSYVMKSVVTLPEDVVGIFCTYLPSTAAMSLLGVLAIMRHSYYWRWKTQNCWHSIDHHYQYGVGSVSFSLFTMKVATTLFMTVLNLSHPQITQDTRPTIVDAQLTPILRMLYGVWVHWFWSLRGTIHLKWTVTYQCQYLTIDSSISEGNYESETRNTEPYIPTNRSSLHWGNPHVDRYLPWFGQPRVTGSGFCTVSEQNRPVVVVQTQTVCRLPGLIGNTSNFATIQHGYQHA